MKNADATPTKDFFVRMITKDISLEDLWRTAFSI